MANDQGGKSEKELALWMLDRIADSEEFIGVIRAGRAAARPDILDTPDYVARHNGRIKKLYQSDDDGTVDTSTTLAGTMAEIVARDMLSSREELVEKALAAYIARSARGADGLPMDWQSTRDLARQEVEGQIKGAFEPGFVGALAAAARLELARQTAAEKSRDRARKERDR